MELARPGATVNYEVWGEAGRRVPWVVLVNGHTRPLNDYRLMGRHLVENGFRVAALDNRGAGLTVTGRPFTFDEMVGDLVALLDEIGAETAHVAGISMGGFLAQALALTDPARVDRLALISTAASHAMIRRDDRPWTADLNAVGAKLSQYFTADFARRNEVLVKSMAKQIAKNVDGAQFAERSELQREAVKGFDARARLAGIECRTLVVHGTDDAIIPVEAARELARLIPGAELTEVEGAGHLLLAEKPRELYDLIVHFFRDRPAA